MKTGLDRTCYVIYFTVDRINAVILDFWNNGYVRRQLQNLNLTALQIKIWWPIFVFFPQYLFGRWELGLKMYLPFKYVKSSRKIFWSHFFNLCSKVARNIKKKIKCLYKLQSLLFRTNTFHYTTIVIETFALCF